MRKQRIIEKEYTFAIPRNALIREVPSSIGIFNLQESSEYHIEDIIIERSPKPLADEKAGMRIRIRDREDVGELTYKKFLGRENGIAKYDEQTLVLMDDEVLLFEKTGNLQSLKEKFAFFGSGCDYFVFLKIENNRKKYVYKYKSNVLEVVVEDLIYLKDGKEVKDSMVEVELKILDEDLEFAHEIYAFAEVFDGKEINEGKTSRALRLLDNQ